MPPRKKLARRKAAAPNTRKRAPAKTKALAVVDAVKRESVSATNFLQKQAALFSAVSAWSPARMLVAQQAAFWKGFADTNDIKRTGRRKRRASAH
jgi:hypothetical protein